MSRFFKRTNSLEQNPYVGAEAVDDLDHMMTVVKEKVGRRLATENVKNTLRAEQNSTADAAPATERTISLPHDDTRILLAGNEVSSPSAVEAFERLHHRLMRHQERIPAGRRCVVVTSADACEGKTLVTINLALSCTKVHKSRVLLVDADLRSQGLTDLLKPLPAPGLAEILAGTTTYGEAIYHTNVASFDVLGAGDVSCPSAELLTGQPWKEFITWATENYELVLVDSPPILRVADYDLIAGAATGILYVVRARRTKRGAIEKALKHVESSKLAGIVFNGAEENGARDYYRRYYRCSAPHS